jgi:hypothetical protein
VTYTGTDPLISKVATVNVQVSTPDNANCGSATGAPALSALLTPSGSLPIAVGQDCVDAHRDTPDAWTVTVTYTFFGASQTTTITPTGTPPT